MLVAACDGNRGFVAVLRGVAFVLSPPTNRRGRGNNKGGAKKNKLTRTVGRYLASFLATINMRFILLLFNVRNKKK